MRNIRFHDSTSGKFSVHCVECSDYEIFAFSMESIRSAKHSALSKVSSPNGVMVLARYSGYFNLEFVE